MKRSFPLILLSFVLLLISVLSACGGKPSMDQIQTAVAETLAAMPPPTDQESQVIEITRVIEITKVVMVGVTATPAPPTSTPTQTSIPKTSPTPTVLVQAKPTASATSTPITESGTLGLSLNQLIRRYSDMTDLQKQEFVKTLPGKTVYWIGEVYNVATDGTMILDNPYGSGRVTLKGIPIETAIQIDKGMLVEFRGMIESFGGAFGREIVVTNGSIVRYYFPPTPTPTGTR